jgi:RNA polymerase sigma factor (sigma-70 family)
VNETDEFVELYRAHYPRLVAALVLAGADRPRAEDLGQEAFARTYRQWARVRTGTNPTGYVYTVAFRLLRRRCRAWNDSFDHHDRVVSGHEDVTIDSLSVAATIEAMPPRRRACATLCFYLGFTATDAGRMLGVEASTVRVQLHRARVDLSRALSDAEPVLAQ